MDPISDMFIRIKNAQRAGHSSARIPYSRLKHEIVKVLEGAELVGAVERRGKKVKKVLEVKLLFREGGGPRIEGVRLLSKQGRRIYASSREFHRQREKGIVVVSTSKGVMTTRQARKEKVGGELIAEVW